MNSVEEEYEEGHGACGVAAVVDLDGKYSNDIVRTAVEAGKRMHLRSGVTYDDNGEIVAVDGGGVLIDLNKDEWAQALSSHQRSGIGDLSRLQVASFHLDSNVSQLALDGTRSAVEKCFQREGVKILRWVPVETDEAVIGERRTKQSPLYEHLFYLSNGVDANEDAKDIFTIGRRINSDIRNVKAGSLALDRVVFKGLLTGAELMEYFPVLKSLTASRALSHVRFATNVRTVNHLAQPFGTVAHNGEINSVNANRKAFVGLGRLEKFYKKILMSGGSDSAHLNDALDLMLANGVPLPEALLRLIPPALLKINNDEFREFIRASKRAMGVVGMWEGPAGVLAFDNKHFVAHSDRLGLRPMFYAESQNGKGHRLNFASEAGAIPLKFSEVLKTGRLEAGGLVAVRFEDGRILQGDELFEDILRNTGLNWEELNSKRLLVPSASVPNSCLEEVKLSLNSVRNNEDLLRKLSGFGWSLTTIKSAVDRIKAGKSVITSLGAHGPLPILDTNLANINDLFLQRAAIITNPPIDPTGEADVVEQGIQLGKMPEAKVSKRRYLPIHPQWQLDSPIISDDVLSEMLRRSYTLALEGESRPPLMRRVDITFSGDSYAKFSDRLNSIVSEVVKVAQTDSRDETSIIVLSDRAAFSGNGELRIPIPPVLLVQLIQTELVRQGLDRNLSIVVDSGTIRSAHDSGVLIAQGASAVCPYMLDRIARCAVNREQALHNLYRGENMELVKMMAKLGLSTSLGARGGYWFSAVGLSAEVSFAGNAKTISKVGGMDIRDIFDRLVMSQRLRFENHEEWIARTADKQEKAEGAYDNVTRDLLILTAFPDLKKLRKILSEEEYPSLYVDGEISPEDISALAYKVACQIRSGKILTLRDCLDINYKDSECTDESFENAPSIESILKRVFMAHMSLGALGPEAHAAIVRGCKAVGVLSASGEGGEEIERSRNGSRAIDRAESKQIGTAGWGVDLRYLMEADEICIKIAQGAKPGEGGDLPGPKVNEFVAGIRHVKVGTRLISPPPNHDIYSIEDLKARIRGLKGVNPNAKISIKLASMPGLGTISVGAVKAGAEVIEISGYDGGTGAAGEQSINHTGLPVEIGLAEVHQFLVSAGLRHRVQLRADGKMMTAKDYVKMVLMGADGISLGSLLMSFVKCTSCKSCHTNRCPAGITTQDEDRIRANFVGGIKEETKANLSELQIAIGAQGVVNGLNAFAREVKIELARLGIDEESFAKMVGRVDLLTQPETGNPAIDSLDLEKELLKKIGSFKPFDIDGERIVIKEAVCGVVVSELGERIVDDAEAFLSGEVDNLELFYETENTDREVGARLAGEIYEKLTRFGKLDFGRRITVNTKGYAGHNYGFAIGDGITMKHEGFLNDSVGQYMSGNAKIVIKCPEELNEGVQALLGNQACMCAVGGSLYCDGTAGARLGVRNSGATIITLGAGDYPFEYMTAGKGILLGDFIGVIGSRMTGGELFLYDPEGTRRQRVAKDYIEVVDMNEDDCNSVFSELISFYAETGSREAFRILENWENEKVNFSLCVPRQDS